jgi:Rrf2 family protein
MLFSTTTQYAIRGLTELAARMRPFHGPARASVMLDQLVAGTDLPREFLAKVFQQLVRAGILTSSKGRGGGFALARATHEISLLQIIAAIDGPGDCDLCVVGLAQCNDALPCPQHDLFKPIRQRLKDYLQTTTLADMVASVKARGQAGEEGK